MTKAKKKYYYISDVSEMFDVHPQTLRLYEREGLITPSRSDGNTRLYDDATIQQLKRILVFTRDLGVNLAGVEIILHMREKMIKMQKEFKVVLEMAARELKEKRRMRPPTGLATVSKGTIVPKNK